ncbi:hypothetical protein [Paenibacillus periandrae]|uniref:hypothetical protein n=1 Tax=Paenibacillus periandrae TaxID=1761741 RepID=UPI001F08C784|nr:hypothetical protein [Paenibacillus periandrae]
MNDDSLLHRIHNITKEELFALYQLADPRQSLIYKDLSIVLSGIAVGVTEQKENDIDKNCIIIGGPCICYCQANISKINIQDIVDIIYPLLTAKQMGSKCLIYFQIKESVDQQIAIDHYHSAVDSWNTLFEKLTLLTKHIMSLLGMSDKEVSIISTAEPRIDEIITNILSLDEVNRHLTEEILYGLYSINNTGSHPMGNEFEKLLLEVYKRNIISYLPVTINKILDLREDVDVLVVENCTQIKTSYRASELHRAVFKTNSEISHLAYISTPGLNGYEMNQSYPRHQIRLETEDAYILKNLNRSSEGVKSYYSNIFPENLYPSELDYVEQVIYSLNNIRELVL